MITDNAWHMNTPGRDELSQCTYKFFSNLAGTCRARIKDRFSSGDWAARVQSNSDLTGETSQYQSNKDNKTLLFLHYKTICVPFKQN